LEFCLAENPAAEIAVLEVMNQKNTPYTKGIRLGDYTIVRDKILDYLEKAFAGELTPKEALDKAIEEGNQLLSEFEAKHSQATAR
jgi:sn-glycerol 3-phosphate transport system substrate-binding protein